MRDRNELYPAPPIEGAIPPTEELLRARLGEAPNAALHFSLANLLQREGRYAESIFEYREAIKLLPESAELHANLGVALALSDKFEEALSHLRQASLLRADLVLPHLHSGHILAEQNQLDGAVQAFERAMKLEPSRATSYVGLGAIAIRRGDVDSAREWFSAAFERDPSLTGVRNSLAYWAFGEGKALVEKGEFEAGFKVWAEANNKLQPSFSEDQRIVQGMADLLGRAKEASLLERTIREHEASLTDPDRRSSACYRIFSRAFYTFGLYPEHFEAEDELELGIARWRKSLATEGEHPFPHFRLGLIFCYQGLLDLADSEIRNCQDKLPSKKQSSLKLSRVLDAIAAVKAAEARGSGKPIDATQEEWERYGFAYPFQSNAWVKAGIKPEVAATWRDEGLTPPIAAAWSKHQIAPGDAAKWITGGFSAPEEVKQWLRGGFQPEEVGSWVEFFKGEIDKAVQARKAGFHDPAQAQAWLNEFMFPWEAAQWMAQGFSLEDAKYWRDAGVRDAFSAWQEKLALDAAIASQNADKEEAD